MFIQSTITLSEILKTMHAGEVFSIKVVSFDAKKKNTSGRELIYAAARLESMENPKKEIRHSAHYPKRSATTNVRYVRNIRIYENGSPVQKIVKVHPSLILEFNSKRLLL